MSDPIADMLTRVRNAVAARHDFVMVPASRMKLEMVKVLKDEGFISEYEVVGGKPQRILKIKLRYDENSRPFIAGLKRVSKPGLRIYVGSHEIPRVYGGLGIALLSTPKGILTGQQAWREKVGGELLCYVW